MCPQTSDLCFAARARYCLLESHGKSPAFLCGVVVLPLPGCVRHRAAAAAWPPRSALATPRPGLPCEIGDLPGC